VAGRITLVNGHQIGTRSLDQLGRTVIGVIDDLAQHHHRHFVRAQLGGNAIGQRPVEILVVQDTGMHQPTHQGLSVHSVLCFGGNPVPDRVHGGKFLARFHHGLSSFFATNLVS